MKDSKKSILAWSLYDWANSAFATTVIAGFFPVFFKAYWADQTDIHQSTFYLGLSNSISASIVAILAPILGAIADRGTAKKKFLFFFTFLGITMTIGLWFVSRGFWQMAILIYVLAAVGYNSSQIFYDSLLPGIASNQKVDHTSSLGFAMGYLGGGLLFLINVLMYLKPELFNIADKSTAVRLSFVSVGIWWAVFSIPIWLWVEEPTIFEHVSVVQAVSLGLLQLIDTLKHITRLRVVGLFLCAYWLYIDGVYTIFRMGVDYGMSLGFPASSLIIALLIIQFISFPAVLFYNWISSRIGIKLALLVAICGYSCITFMGFFMSALWQFFGLAAMIGLLQGGIQALSRSLYTRIIPRDKAAECFGFYNLVGRSAAIIGPAMMGIITLWTGNIRYGILSILFLLIPGAFFLLKVDIKRGEEISRN